MTFTTIPDSWPLERDPAQPLLPPPRFDEIRALGEPVELRMYDDTRAVLLTRYDEIRDALMSPDISSDGTLPGFPYVSEATRANRGRRLTIDRLDPPVHDQQRAMLAAAFTQKRVRELRPFVEEAVDGLLDDLEAAGPGVDFVSVFAESLPAIVICRMLDLPLTDAPFLLDRIHRWTNDKGDPADIIQATQDMNDYFEKIIDARLEGDGTDPVSLLVRNQLVPGNLTRQQVLMTCHLLITAGFDTTTNAIALGTVLLLQNPDAWQEVVKDDEGTVIQSTIEEMLRYLSVAHGTHIRLARAEIPAGHHVLPAGVGVLAPQAAANHDPAQFPEPATFDIHRDARSHLAFSAGVHQCLGQQLARLELNVVFDRLPKRFPGLRLMGPMETLPYRPNAMVYGVTAMPVSW